MFLRIVDTPVEKVKVSFYYRQPHIYKDAHDTFGNNTIILPQKYTEEYLTYLSLLDNWIQAEVAPRDIKGVYEFRTIPANDISQDFVYTRYYQKHNDKIRQLLRGETVCKLSDVADIEETSLISGSKKIARVLFQGSVPSYPYIPEKDSVEYPATSICLQKGDVVEYRGDYFLFCYDTDIEIYAPICSRVIRAKSFSPEYLYFYLCSKTARQIQQAFSVIGGNSINPKPLNIQDFPIVLPTQDEQYYKDQFALLAKPDRVYEYVKVTPESTLAAALGSDCLARLKHKNDMMLKTLIENDFAELKICYEHKAYKAAIIMAGSLLEVFIIDWISEIDRQDYFSYTLRYTDADGKTKYADLNRYIEELGSRLGTSWNRTKVLAHDIRNKRNSVHVKVSLKYPTHNPSAACAQTIKDLEAIIKSRSINLLP